MHCPLIFGLPPQIENPGYGPVLVGNPVRRVDLFDRGPATAAAAAARCATSRRAAFLWAVVSRCRSALLVDLRHDRRADLLEIIEAIFELLFARLLVAVEQRKHL